MTASVRSRQAGDWIEKATHRQKYNTTDKKRDMTTADPLDDIDPKPLSEQLKPYLQFDIVDAELAVSLRTYERRFGGPGLPGRPADHTAEYHCQNCNEDVRSISDGDRILVCPLCGEIPGMLTLGEGPTGGGWNE